ncbi:hypothetical protein B0C58_004718 [Salmonella enterica subsp. enterica serovar Oranienburg]|nr:hypothetical protein [Salmonella enterica subsp. enterica serovar Oranienburg]
MGGWNLYQYPLNPVDENDPLGLCPPGRHRATKDEIQKILDAANTRIQANTSPSRSAYNAQMCNQYVDRSIKDAFPGSIQGEPNTTQIRAGVEYFSEVSTPSVGNLALLSNPGHVVFVTSVDNGKVTGFSGSQSSTGPGQVQLPNRYWSPKFDSDSTKFFDICFPD